jgi:hypothetical protein
MKQVIVLFLCVVAVMLVGYAVQKENLFFGPMAILADPLPLDSEHVAEEPLPDLLPEPALLPPSPFAVFSNEDDPREANTGVRRSGGW